MCFSQPGFVFLGLKVYLKHTFGDQNNFRPATWIPFEVNLEKHEKLILDLNKCFLFPFLHILGMNESSFRIFPNSIFKSPRF